MDIERSIAILAVAGLILTLVAGIWIHAYVVSRVLKARDQEEDSP